MKLKSVIILFTVVSERLGAHVLELPYKGNKVSMFIILPPNAKSNGIESVIKQLSVESLQEIVEDDLPRAVEVSIPKFTIEQTIELTAVSLHDQQGTSSLY
jgi:serpin B